MSGTDTELQQFSFGARVRFWPEGRGARFSSLIGRVVEREGLPAQLQDPALVSVQIDEPPPLPGYCRVWAGPPEWVDVIE